MTGTATGNETAAERWARELGEWAIPQAILDQAPSGPFTLSPNRFAPPPPRQPGDPVSLATARALEALPDGGSVLDVGCGGGTASLALAPPAALLIGTDRQANMIERFLATAAERGIDAVGQVGTWPEAAALVPEADVVVSRNVLYNAPAVTGFVLALTAKARRRVVVEITDHHPQRVRAPLWRHFWNLDRPTGPTATVAAAAIAEAGLPVVMEEASPDDAAPPPSRADAAFWCRQLCLPPEREPEVAELMTTLGGCSRPVCLWWDTA